MNKNVCVSINMNKNELALHAADFADRHGAGGAFVYSPAEYTIG